MIKILKCNAQTQVETITVTPKQYAKDLLDDKLDLVMEWQSNQWNTTKDDMTEKELIAVHRQLSNLVYRIKRDFKI